MSRQAPFKRLVRAVVTSPKTSSAYQAHSYPTKIPPEAIVPFIDAYTKPGDKVLDPFCGSGMTGVAALLANRAAVLSDLSPGAVHLARNHVRRIDPCHLVQALEVFEVSWMQAFERQLYGAKCPSCSGKAMARHTIWSEVHSCASCDAELVLWDFADCDDGSVPRVLQCSECGGRVVRSGAIPLRSEPVEIAVSCPRCSRLQRGAPVAGDIRKLKRLENEVNPHWLPLSKVEVDREMYKRSALHLKSVNDVRDFYLPRAQLALARLWAEIGKVTEAGLREALQFAFTNTAWHASRMRRYNTRGGQRPLTGTLYIPQLTAEANVFEVYRHQVAQVAGYYSQLPPAVTSEIVVRQSSAADLSWLPNDSIDYVFTDPPFGSNIFYADCNLVWEAWLGSVTDATDEMVVNRSKTQSEGGKSVDWYREMLRRAFAEMRRVVRPGGRISVIFHNSDDQIWAAMLRAAEEAGLKQVEVSLLDKVQRSMKGYKGRSGRELVPFYDLAITFTSGRTRRVHLNGAGELAVETVKQHLKSFNDQSLERSLEFLYSLAVSSVVGQGMRPDGLSFRAFEQLCDQHFARQGTAYFLR